MKIPGCSSCGEESPEGECPKSKRACGHHCNHSWSHDACHWCGEEFGEAPEDATPKSESELEYEQGRFGLVVVPGKGVRRLGGS
jgi:hypothetical protein